MPKVMLLLAYHKTGEGNLLYWMELTNNCHCYCYCYCYYYYNYDAITTTTITTITTTTGTMPELLEHNTVVGDCNQDRVALCE
jgi:hypothetical protein